MDVVDKFYELIDNCCMLLNKKLHLNYFDSLVRVCNDITYELDDSKLDDEDIKILESKYQEIYNIQITNEEVRQAMELLIVKGMKHINMSLDIMTPDYINYLFAYLINEFFKNRKEISILDVEVGTGNLINSISNFIPIDSILYGVENNKQLVDLCKANTNIQNNTINIYFQDVLTKLIESFDVIIGDLDCKKIDEKYYPYNIIINYLNNLNEDGLFIYLIENDFFAQKQMNEFKNQFNGTLFGLIVLPQELFQEGFVGKSLLIGSSKKVNNFEMMAIQMPNINNKEKFYQSLDEIQEWIKKIKESI